MDLGAFHPQIVHTPIALLIFSALFSLIGRLLDRDWLRRAGTLMLVIGFLGAFAAVRSGDAAHEVPEEQQGVPENAIDDHEDAAQRVLIVAGVALVATLAASRLKGGAASALGTVALLAQVGAAVLVGIAGHKGGKLVYEHGANVRVGGALVRSGTPAAAEPGEHEANEAH